MTLHQIVETARATSCARCHVLPGQPCDCSHGGVHLARVARARASGLLAADDFASVIADGEVFTGASVVTDPDWRAA